MAFPCGGCLPCRHSRARVWSHRLMLEATQHEENCFVTLTYTDTHVIQSPHVNPRHIQLFIKRLRKRGQKFRYYAVGEYGPSTWRPHYHLAAFGLPGCERGQTDLRKENCCPQCTLLRDTWGMGAVQLARLEPASAAYIAGYVTQKLTAPKLPTNLHPQFQRMSLRPGIGYACMHDVANVLLTHYPNLEDVPIALSHGKSKLPLGKYLRRSLRKMMGSPDGKAPQATLKKMAQEMQPLREIAFHNSSSFAKAITDTNQGKRISFLARKRIFQQKARI